MKDPELQTRHTVQAHELADAVNAGLSKVSLPPGHYVPELTAPEGPSTGGGVQSMQHVKLVPRAAGFPTLVVGTANHMTGTAELRGFGYVDAVYTARFGSSVPLDAYQYAEFLVTAKNLLEVVQLKVSVAETAPPDALIVTTTLAPKPEKIAGIETGTLVAIFLGVVVAVAAVATLVLSGD